jgi:predicted kinase
MTHSQRRFIVVCGPPCSGKSTIARSLSERIGAIHLELDSILVRVLPGSRHSQPDRDLAYRTIHVIGEYLLESQDQVILDATYARKQARADLEKLRERTGAAIAMIQCKIPPETARTRFLDRRAGHLAVDLDESRVFRLAEEYPYLESSLIVDATLPTPEILRLIESYISY